MPSRESGRSGDWIFAVTQGGGVFAGRWACGLGREKAVWGFASICWAGTRGLAGLRRMNGTESVIGFVRRRAVRGVDGRG